MISKNEISLLENKITSLVENVSLLNTEMRSFEIFEIICYSATISNKKTAKETSSVGSSQSELNRLQDEITYLREECNTKNGIIQTLLESQKVRTQEILEVLTKMQKFTPNLSLYLKNLHQISEHLNVK